MNKIAALLRPAEDTEWLYIGKLKNGDELFQKNSTPYIYKIRSEGKDLPEYYQLVGIEYAGR